MKKIEILNLKFEVTETNLDKTVQIFKTQHERQSCLNHLKKKRWWLNLTDFKLSSAPLFLNFMTLLKLSFQ